MNDQDIKGEILNSLREVRKDVSHINRNIVDIKVVQGQNSVILQEHMRRTEANEALIVLIRDENAKRIDKIEQFKWYFAGIAVIITVVADAFRRFL